MQSDGRPEKNLFVLNAHASIEETEIICTKTTFFVLTGQTSHHRTGPRTLL